MVAKLSYRRDLEPNRNWSHGQLHTRYTLNKLKESNQRMGLTVTFASDLG